jgi:hypothetical protein
VHILAKLKNTTRETPSHDASRAQAAKVGVHVPFVPELCTATNDASRATDKRTPPRHVQG